MLHGVRIMLVAFECRSPAVDAAPSPQGTYLEIFAEVPPKHCDSNLHVVELEILEHT